MNPGEGRRFPILGIKQRDIEDHPDRPRNVPWAMLSPFEANAKKNHDQSLERLAERGGLSVTEMVAIIEGQTIRWIMKQSRDESECWEKLIEHIRQFEGIAASELEYLRWFYSNAETMVSPERSMKTYSEMFEKETGKKAPKGY